ncbi:unnamed protein product [Rotaria sp. Silwood1]|nr:unnamed protein product [Rotaria sp. Silwood1]CAF5013748.1 unnamed protein product [Rotaria sp. Silwood1]CAF5139578.1 unnamed protein product [Rotaria sp. Silwood1]
MPKEFSLEFKQLAFSVIDFVEKEKNGSLIPLYNVTDRLEAILGVSRRSVNRLKQELKELKKEQEESVRFTRSSNSLSSLTPLSPVGRSGRPKVQLTMFEQDTIRLIFHQLLQDKVYPTLENLLSTLLNQHPDFPIKSKTSLYRQLKILGFTYRKTKKAKILLDSVALQAQLAAYFRKMDQLRSNNYIIYYQDETWLSKNEEKTVVWFDDEGYGRLRNSEGKGPRLAISGLLGLNGFHLRSLDIFKCDEEHSMDNYKFVTWMESTASTLRSEHGTSAQIAIIIDNATWHNKLTPESEPPKRAWKKQLIVDWLINQYIVDNVASKYNIEVVRIPVKHCVLNPIELAWAGLKNYVRKHNVRFSLNDIAQLCNEWLAACGPEYVAGYLSHVHKNEEIFKAADKNVEVLENDLVDTDYDIDDDIINDDDESDG